MNNTDDNILILRLPASSGSVVTSSASSSAAIVTSSLSSNDMNTSPTVANVVHPTTTPSSPSSSSPSPLPYYTVSSTFLPLLLHQIKSLFMDYRQALLSHDVPIDLFQGFGDEIQALPYKYVQQLNGTILLAVKRLSPEEITEYESSLTPEDDSNLKFVPFSITLDSDPARSILVQTMGCIALKDIGNNVGEVKRLYVLPPYRRTGLGYRLSSCLESITRKEFPFYTKLVLDTLRRLEGALPLYKRLGYTECTPYVYNPMPDVVFLEKLL